MGRNLDSVKSEAKQVDDSEQLYHDEEQILKTIRNKYTGLTPKTLKLSIGSLFGLGKFIRILLIIVYLVDAFWYPSCSVPGSR